MEFNEIVEHEVQLRHVETIKINAEKKKEYVENTLSIRASTKGEIRKEDKMRSSYYSYYTGRNWYDMEKDRNY